MNHICPICNGFSILHFACPDCGRHVADTGRLYDYYGDYSPYREIDDAKLSNGFADLQHHLCIHVGWCPACCNEQLIAVKEWGT